MAIANQRDQDHAAASDVFRGLVQKGWRIYSSNWTWYDALSHMKERKKGGGLTAAKALRDVEADHHTISVLRVNERLEARALDLFWETEDKAWSVTTCVNIVLMRELELIYVLSANHHYRQAGLKTLY